MEIRNCSLPAPSFYSSAMHNFHIVSFPVYIVTLNALFRESSPMFSTYKYYLIVHILINIISETYVSFFMLPMTYLPQPLIRNTGWLAELGFSGMFIFYGLAQSVMLTVGSILEMFFFRYKLIAVFKKDTFKTLLRLQIMAYRFFIVFHPIFGAITISHSIGVEARSTTKLWQENPNLPPEVTCYSCIMAVFDDWVFYILVILYGIEVVLQFTVSNGVLMYILKHVKKAQGMSNSTVKLQKMLIFSLFIQGTIHGGMIMLPTIFMIYALFFNSPLNDLALACLMGVAYHGFVSTCAMIIFTKPLREKIVPFIKLNPAPQSRIADMSRLRSTSSHEIQSHNSTHSQQQIRRSTNVI